MAGRNLYYFVSDIHLGLRFKDYKEREKRFALFLEQLPCETKALYLLGDIFDFWYEYKHVIPRGFTRTLGALAKLADAGVEVRFFNGNHDIWTYNYLQQEIGIKVEQQPKTEMIGGKSFFMAHGDGISSGDFGYKMLKAIFHCRFLQILFSSIHPRWAFGLGHSWSKHNRLTRSSDFKPEKHSGETPLSEAPAALLPLINYAEKVQKEQSEAGKGIDYFIFGHYHFGQDYALRPTGRMFVMGEWINLFDYLVFDGNTLERRYFVPGGTPKSE